jgi:sulfur-carrier protein
MLEMVRLFLILVHISGHLKDYTGKKRDVEISDSVLDVFSLIEELDQEFPGIKDRILDDQNNTREFVNIFVNGTNIRDGVGESTNLKAGDTVHILPSVAGGRCA